MLLRGGGSHFTVGCPLISVLEQPRVCQSGPSSIGYNQRGGADFRLEPAGLR